MPRKVLVVDDYDDARELVSLILEDAGYAVISAANGIEAVAMAKAYTPDAVLMDVFMPGMDGFEATRRIKADPALSNVPIVAYTARPPIDPPPELFTAVCVKPCAPDVVLAAIRNALEAAPRTSLA